MIDQKAIRQKLPTSVRRERGTHAGLWLDKHILDQKRGNNESRRALVNDVADLPEPPEYKAFFTRWEAALNGFGAHTRQVRVRGRMAVGLGSESLLETSISLHHAYGVPYIPGSALKGLAASYAHHYLGNEWRRGGQFYTVIFGNTADAGYMTFFDALYIPGTAENKKPLSADVITVHHRKYYQGTSEVPVDNDDPYPIPFLSTAPR